MVYERIDDIPYSVLRRGGEFEVNILPSEMQQVGLGMVAQESDPGRLPIWLIAFAKVALYSVCTVVIVRSITGLVATIRAVPEGRIVDTLPDGTRLYESPTGGSYLLHPDGTNDEVSPPPSTIAAAIIGVIVVVVVAVMIIQIAIPYFKKKVVKDEGGK